MNDSAGRVRRGSQSGRRAIAAARMQPADPIGTTRANPVPLGEEVGAGPVALTVLEVVVGEAATADLLEASATNSPPRDGVVFVLARVSARNTGPTPLPISDDDFALTGNSGLVRRFLGAQPPEPALTGALEPGQTREGWLALSAPADETDLLLIFDSLALPGNWAVRYLALERDAAIADPAPLAVSNGAGVDPARPAGVGESVVTGQWRLELLETAVGAAAFDLVDYRTGALEIDDSTGASDGSVWLALRFRIANVGAGPATFPVNAFALADPAGTALLDMTTLTPPKPDAAGDYFPGAEREGWVAFDVPQEVQPVLVRFLPYAHTEPVPDPRYFAPG
ncbi:MAG: DUF4352 domain-containing protein [Thermomicrobiales bacterium]|nr:DUF4352 domain-containing protein [Thermomicrobiales bacterium]